MKNVLKKALSMLLVLTLFITISQMDFTTVKAEEGQYSAYIDYSPEEKTANITIYVNGIHLFDLGILSEATCVKVQQTEEFRNYIYDNGDYILSGMGHPSYEDSAGHTYATYSAAGMSEEDTTEPVPYEGSFVTFEYENVEAGTVFTIVKQPSGVDDVTTCSKLTELYAAEGQPTMPPKPTDTAMPSNPTDTPMPTVEPNQTEAPTEIPNTLPPTAPPSGFFGDVIIDFSIDARDALAVLKHAAKISIINDIQNADVNMDGVADATDALFILKYAARLIPDLSWESTHATPAPSEWSTPTPNPPTPIPTNIPAEVKEYSVDLGNGQTTTVRGYYKVNEVNAAYTILNGIRFEAYYDNLTINNELEEMAKLRACEASYYFSHTRPNGQDCFSVDNSPNVFANAENIAMGYVDAKSVIEGWLESPGHNENMLNSTSTCIGMACFVRVDDYGNETAYWVQLFGI